MPKASLYVLWTVDRQRSCVEVSCGRLKYLWTVEIPAALKDAALQQMKCPTDVESLRRSGFKV